MKKLRIGVIGVGGRGTLAHLWDNDEWGSSVVAGSDTNTQCLADFKDHFKGKVDITADYRDLLKRDDIDAVAVFTPDFLHEEHAVAVLEAGKHLFCEKPLAITVKGCDHILKAWKKSGRKFLMGFNMRYMYYIRTMKKIIDEGAIGELKTVWVRHFVAHGSEWYYHDWHANRKNSTSLLLQKASHDIDVVHWLAGSYGKRVVGMGGLHMFGGKKPNTLTCDKCSTRETCAEALSVKQTSRASHRLCAFRKEVDVEDVNEILWELENGVQCAYMQCHFASMNYKARNYVFIGTEGMVENYYKDGQDHIEVTTRKGHSWNAYADRDYKIKTPPGTHSGADPIIAKEFVDVLLRNTKPTATPIDGRQSVAVGCAGAESIRNGSIPVDIPPLPKL